MIKGQALYTALYALSGDSNKTDMFLLTNIGLYYQFFDFDTFTFNLMAHKYVTKFI